MRNNRVKTVYTASLISLSFRYSLKAKLLGGIIGEQQCPLGSPPNRRTKEDGFNPIKFRNCLKRNFQGKIYERGVAMRRVSANLFSNRIIEMRNNRVKTVHTAILISLSFIFSLKTYVYRSTP